MSVGDPRLYVFVRSDLQSLTIGKACAQVAHAASQAAAQMNNSSSLTKQMYQSWDNSADEYAINNKLHSEYQGGYRHFGTTIVLDGGDAATMYDTYNQFGSLSAVGFGAVVDPTYPLKDGTAMHFLNIPTCIWLFGDPSTNDQLKAFLNGYKLFDGFKAVSQWTK